LVTEGLNITHETAICRYLHNWFKLDSRITVELGY